MSDENDEKGETFVLEVSAAVREILRTTIRSTSNSHEGIAALTIALGAVQIVASSRAKDPVKQGRYVEAVNRAVNDAPPHMLARLAEEAMESVRAERSEEHPTRYAGTA